MTDHARHRRRPYGAAAVLTLTGTLLAVFALTGTRTDGQVAGGLLLAACTFALTVAMLTETRHPTVTLDRRLARDGLLHAHERHPTRSARHLRLAVNGDPDAIRRELDVAGRDLGPLERRRR